MRCLTSKHEPLLQGSHYLNEDCQGGRGLLRDIPKRSINPFTGSSSQHNDKTVNAFLME